MFEMIQEENVAVFFYLLTAISPLLGLLAAILKGRKILPLRNWLIAAVILIGPLNLACWTLYGVLIDLLGLTSVKLLIVSGILFALLGLLIGFVSYLFREFLNR